MFVSLLTYAREKHLPKKRVRYNKKKHKKNKWMTNGILNSINMKDRLYKIFIQTDPRNELIYDRLREEYKKYRKTLRKSIREAKRLYYMRTFNTFRNDVKKTWAVINDTMNKRVKCETHDEFFVDNRIIRDPEEIANSFNDYFINIGSSIASKLQPSLHYTQYLGNATDSRLKFNAVTLEQVSKLINRLKNKTTFGHDNISNKLLKYAKEVLVKPLTHLINQTLETGHFPSELKISRVKALFKKGDSTLLSNYRPISLLPSISKLYEYVIFDQLFDYLNQNNLLCLEQYGFRRGHSTELAALKLVDHLTKKMDRGDTPLNVYIDLSKAFDTLDHNILLEKLRYYGIHGIEHTLMYNYLTDRHQYVEYKHSLSEIKPISTGVPQGSILGPLLFLIYINDLPTVSQMFDMIMYADDTTLYCNINEYITEHDINTELARIYDWLTSNKLALNVSKTKFMVFHSARKIVTYPCLKLNNIEIEKVQTFNFLGLVLNSSLKWNTHINHIRTKIARTIGLMTRLKHIYPRAALLILYNALIIPNFTYCLLVWGSKVVNDHPLHLLQKRALRIITNNDFLAHSEPICKELRLTKVPDMYHLSIWKFYFKLMNNRLPPYFNFMIPSLPRVCDHYAIRRPTFHLPHIVHEFAQHLVEYQMIKLLNQPNAHMYTVKVQTHSFEGFKHFIKHRIIESYRDHCVVPNCDSCAIMNRRNNERDILRQ